MISGIEQIENRREANPEIPAVYLVSALPYVVDILISDMNRRKYQSFHLLWTSSKSRVRAMYCINTM